MGAWLDLDDVVYNHHVARRQLQELRAENKKYRLGMQENCKLRARIAELEAERDRLREALEWIAEAGGYDASDLEEKARAALQQEGK